MEFRLLGAVELDAGGQVWLAGPPQQRLVIAAIAADAGRPVPAEVLIDRVWDEAPAGARRTLHMLISRIRRLLRQADTVGTGPVQVVHRSGGYVLDIDPERVDLHRFRRLMRQACDPGLVADDVVRAKMFNEALALWRGDPLAGLPGGWAAGVRQAWRQEHLDAVVAWAHVQLRVGDAGTTLGPLRALAEEHPLTESVTAVLMQALYAIGRRADALDLYAKTRQFLADELGTDPSHEVQIVHQAILHGDLTPTAPTPRSPWMTRPTPAQLPPDVDGFAGRDAYLARLDAMVDGAGRTSAAALIMVITGTAGVGKTALAVFWAHRVADRFPDGQLYMDLRGFGPGGSVVAPADAVRRVLDALGMPPERIPVDLDAQAALYRSHLVGRRMLVVLDNARDSAQVRPLLPAAPTCLVLVTSRNQLSGLVAADGAHPIDLDVPSVSGSRELLAQRLGTGRVAAEPGSVEEIITRCARLPLALALVAARAAARPGVALRVLADELADARQRWQTLTGDDPHTDVQAVFSWSYQARTPEAARLFRLLGLHPGPDISAPAAASLAGLAPDAVRPVLAELTRANVLTEPTPGRYTFHDLLRDYATQLADSIDTDEQRHAAAGRILDHYLHTADPAALLLNPTRDPVPLAPPRAGVTPQQLTDIDQALGWFTAEQQVLMAAVTHAAATGFDTHTWQLAWTLGTFLYRRGQWHDQVAVGQAAVAAARRLDDPATRAHTHRNLAHVYIYLGRFEDAYIQLRQALDMATSTGDQTQQAHTHRGLAYLWGRRGQAAQALLHARHALRLFQATGYQVSQARALNQVGWCHALIGEHQQALIYCQQALALHQQLGDRYGQANAWDSLGYTHHHLGQHTQGVTCYGHAVTLFRDLGDRYDEADSLTHLGDTHHATGDLQAARNAWQQALTILNDLDHPDAEQVHAKLATLDPPTDQATP